MKRISLPVTCGILLLLGSCSQLQQTAETAADPVAPTAVNDDGELPAEAGAPAESNIVPTEEQQASAQRMLEDTASGVPVQPVVSSPGQDYEPGYEPYYAPTQQGVPGGRGIRMGQMAPPEEAASTSDGAAPKPNQVERSGYRSPSLPQGLPMEMNGKVNPASTR